MPLFPPREGRPKGKNILLILTALTGVVWPAMGRSVPQRPLQTSPQAVGAAQATEEKLRLVRAVAGSKGRKQRETYIIEDPRTVFNVPQDKEIVVYFEWEGPRGVHHFEGVWKNPQGKPTVFSDFSYEATSGRFGAYWKLVLSEDMQPGLWALEARVDGEPAGTEAVQIVAAPRPAPVTPIRPILTPSQVYQRALAATATIENLGSDRERLGVGSGFFIAQGLLVTAFQVIDGASALRITLPGGEQTETNQVVAWNRRQDWAVLKVASETTARLERAKPKSWAVGDRCFHLDTTAQGARVIVDTNVVGEHSFQDAGERLDLAGRPGRGALGSALINELGDVIAVLGGTLIPGAETVESAHGVFRMIPPGIQNQFYSVLAVPLELVPEFAADAKPVTLQELAQQNQFLTPLQRTENISAGALARDIQSASGFPRTVDERVEFSSRDPGVAVLITWDPKEKIKGVVDLRVYDLDNRLLSQSKPLKTKLEPGHVSFSSWKVGIAPLAPGVYRVDVTLQGAPIWRTFFRITQ